MKKAKFIFITLIASMGILSFVGQNNFSEKGLSFLFEEKTTTITHEEFNTYIYKELIAPITECYSFAYPHAFMTKCYSSINFVFTEDWRASGEKINVDYPFSGDLVFNDCGQSQHVCSVTVDYLKNEIKVRESFLSDWITKDAYLTSFCEKMNKLKDGNE